MTSLLDHYLRAVRLYLPRGAEKNDILAELSENLRASLEERATDLGRPLTEVEQEALLNEHGNPLAVAEQYGASRHGLAFGRQIIGPELFPLYARLLLLQFGLTITVWIGFAVAGGPVASPLGILLPLVTQFVLMTTIFAAIEVLQRRSAARQASHQHWHFPPDYLHLVPRWQSLAGFIVLGIAAVWWGLLPFVPALLLGPAVDRLQFAPASAAFYWPVLFLLVAGMAQRATTFVHPELNWLQAIVRLVTNGGALVLLWPFLQTYPFIVAANASDLAAANALALRISATIWWNVLFGLGLYWLINVFFNLWFCFQHLRYAMRRRRQHAAIVEHVSPRHRSA